MNYLNSVEKELRSILDSDEPDAEKWGEKIVKFVREKVLESYRNGFKAALKPRDKNKK